MVADELECFGSLGVVVSCIIRLAHFVICLPQGYKQPTQICIIFFQICLGKLMGSIQILARFLLPAQGKLHQSSQGQFTGK